MRYIFLLSIIGFLYSCDFNQTKSSHSNANAEGDSIVDLEKVKQMKLTSVREYHKVLDKLDKGDLASVDAAITLFKNCTIDSLSRDSMFVTFNDFFNGVAGNYLENNENVSSQLENSPSKEAIDKLRSTLNSYGISLNSSEGTFYLEPQTEYLIQNFGSKVSQACREYLAIQSKEQKVRFAEDGTILIPIDSLTSRIVTWENFMEKYPDFISIKMAQDQYAQYIGAYLSGMDNSRIFDPATNRLNDNSKMSFESFIQKYPDRKSTEVVKAYLELLQSTNFNYTDKVDSFLLEKVYH